MDITYFFKSTIPNSKSDTDKKKDKLKDAYKKIISKLINDQIIDISDYTFLMDFVNCGGCISMLKKYTELTDTILTAQKLDDEIKKKIKYINNALYSHLFDLFKDTNDINISGIIKGMEELNEDEIKFTKDQKLAIQQICIFLYDSTIKTYGLYGFAGTGKCLAPNTPVLMYDGNIKKVSDIVLGEKIMGPDSKPRNVISTCKGIDQMYRINPFKGRSFVCNKSHVLTLKGRDPWLTIRNNRKGKYQVGYTNKGLLKFKSFVEPEEAETFKKNLSEDIFDIPLNEYLKRSNPEKRYSYLFHTGVEFPHKEVPFDPYIIGHWLGDGTSAGCAITTKDKEILEVYSSKLPEYNLELKFIGSTSTYGYRIIQTGKYYKKKGNKMMKMLKNLDLVNNKHIPDIYKINSRDVRLKVLAGLIDSDGYNGGNYLEICQKNKRLSNDIEYLALSLGFMVTSKEVTKGCMYKEEMRYGKYQKLNIFGEGLEDIPVVLKYKKCQARKSKIRANCLNFNVEKLDKSEYCGFELDGDGRFLLGDFTVTHNSTLITKLVHYFLLHNYIKSVVFSAPTNKAVNILKAKFMNDIQSLVQEKVGTTDPDASLNDQLDKLNESGSKINFCTIHRLLNFKNEFDVNGGLVFVKGNKSIINNYDLVLIDECSMIPFQIIISIFEDIRIQVNKFKKTPKILFVGDPAQLPPVNEEVSVIFTDNKLDINYNSYKEHAKGATKLAFTQFQENIKNHNHITMTEIVRSNDDVVVGLCNEVRSWVMDQIKKPKMRKYKCPKIKLYKYDTSQKKTDTEWFKTCLKYFAKNDETMISNVILTWTNKQSKEYNSVVRKRLFKKTKLNEFEVGDILMLNDFYNIKSTSTNGNPNDNKRFYASEQIKINEIEQVTKVLPMFALGLSSKMERAKNFVLIDEKYKQAVKSINKETKRKYNVWKLYVNKLSDVNTKNTIPEYYTIYVLKKDSHADIKKDREFVMNKIKELRSYYQGHLKEQIERLDRAIIKQMWKEYNQKFCEPFANVSYAASITVHSSQCSTYYNVFVDSRDILANNNGRDAKRCIYTAMTRVANELHILI